MKKTIVLCIMLIILLTSCVQVKKIDYTTYCTSFNETNQDNNLKILDEVYYSSIYIYSAENFDKYMNNLNNLSISSYESIKNADYLTYDDVEREINFQKNILTLLEKTTISEDYFYSKQAFYYANVYKNTNIKDLIEARIDYFEILSTDIERSSITTETNLFQIENATLPLLNAEAEKTRANFLQNF